jgi:hypothetical protein
LSKAEKKLIDCAVKHLKVCVEADSDNRTRALDDLRFANGEQWDERERKRRADKGRPCLTLNLLDHFIDQVVGDMLHNTPSIKIRPIDSSADVTIAKIRQGIISGIEYQSNSKGIYGYAGKQMVAGAYGGWRVLTRWCEENPFLQEAYLEAVRNPFLMYLDPRSKDQNYADAEWGFLLEKMPRNEFEDRYPGQVCPCGESFKVGKGLGMELWYDKDAVVIAEYFRKVKETRTMLQLKDGRVCTEDEFKELHEEWEEKQEALITAIAQPTPPQPAQGQQQAPPAPPPSQPGQPQGQQAPPVPQPSQPGQPPVQGQQQAPPPPNPLAQQAKDVGEEPKIVKKRDTEVTTIRHWILTCMEIISGGVEGKHFPGKYIPLVLLKGKEINIEGKNYVRSLIRPAKDNQKLYNFWCTAAAELIALQPKAPWLGTAKQFEGYENDYAAANVENFPMLKYNVDPEAPGPPQRSNPAAPPTAIFEQIRRTEESMKSILGMFNADVGGPTSQQTGAAVNAAQRPGDIGTFEFMENLSRAVMHTGRILNEIIPEIYDTERDVRIRNMDESESFVPVNTTVGKAVKSLEAHPERFHGMDIAKVRTLFAKDGKDAKFNDITAGKYDVVVTVGPSYATQRQESAQNLLQLVQSMPQQMGLAMDLIVENMDFKGADELAGRLRKTLPPNMVKTRPGEAPPMPPPPNPKVLIEQSKLQLQQLKVQQENIRLEHEKVKMQLEIMKLQAAGGKANEDNTNDLQEKAIKLQLEIEKHKLEKSKFEHQKVNDAGKLGVEHRKIDEAQHEEGNKGGQVP